jgi:hypothetical protein
VHAVDHRVDGRHREPARTHDRRVVADAADNARVGARTLRAARELGRDRFDQGALGYRLGAPRRAAS